jgi:hypothetical protein
VVPETLLDRLFFHHQLSLTPTPNIDGHGDIGPDEMQSLDHMLYASAVIAVYRLIQVRTREISYHDVNVEIMFSAWMNFMLSPVDFAETYVSVVSRNGSTSTSHGGDPEPSSQSLSREQIPLVSERYLLSVRRARKKLFEETFLARLLSRFSAYAAVRISVT